ncbi:MAG TPA: hypothetical protein DCS93_29055 [Microscillaceae bacterium]|nr:hypothetical protein [Microscillaceae bacterium]
MNNLFYSKYNYILLICCLLAGCVSTRQGAEAYFKSGSIKSQQGNYKGAIKDFGRVLKINPKHAKAYLGRSNIKYNLKNYSGAIEDCSAAIRLNPELTDAYFNLGISYYELKKYKQAVAEFDKSIQRRPQDAEAYYLRGRAKMHMGDNPGACNDWQKAASMSYTQATEMQKKHCKDTPKAGKMLEEAPAQVREVRDNK